MKRFAAAGFQTFGLPNDYRYHYSMLRRDHDVGVELVPVDAWDDRFTDYAIVR